MLPSRRSSISERMRQKYKLGTEEEEEEDRDDLYKLLEMKESDLILAAELGSALLDKNEEISKQGEKLVVEYSHKLEVLEQEKYQLRRKLELLEDEYRQQLAELNTDMSSVKRSLNKQAQRKKEIERQNSNTIQQLTEENQRLSTEVTKLVKKERHLESHKQVIKTEILGKKTSMQEHFNNMENLNKRIKQIVLDKVMLEKQIEVLAKEIESMTLAVQHSANKIGCIQRKTINQERQIRTYELECEKLRSANQYLSERLENVSRSMEPDITQPTNLLLEMERSVSDFKNIIETKDNAIEDESYEFINIDSDEEIYESERELDDLKSEVFSTYLQARHICTTLRRGGGEYFESSEDLQTVQIAQLNVVLLELERLLVKMGTIDCGSETVACEDIKIELEIELHQTKESIEKTEARLKRVEIESKQKLEQLQDLKSKLELVSISLSAAKEENEMLKTDLQNLSLSKEMMIKTAWNKRDEAVDVKNAAEVELARNRIEMMQISSQLLEAVQQKVSLSQQLDEMEVKMDIFLQEQVKEKLGGGKFDRISDSESGKDTLSRKISRPVLALFGK